MECELKESHTELHSLFHSFLIYRKGVAKTTLSHACVHARSHPHARSALKGSSHSAHTKTQQCTVEVDVPTVSLMKPGEASIYSSVLGAGVYFLLVSPAKDQNRRVLRSLMNGIAEFLLLPQLFFYCASIIQHNDKACSLHVCVKNTRIQPVALLFAAEWMMTLTSNE